MSRIGRILLVLAIGALIGVAVWLRVSSLGSLPEVDGDETWHATQLVHMMRGESYSLRTEHGLPLSAFHAALELPLLVAFRPTLALVRIPTVLTGLLAIVFVYVLGSRIFDRTTALLASVLLAVLPVAIIFSRTGYESSHAPLYGIVLIYLAYRRRFVALSLLLTCCYFVHPTNIFLLPVLLVAMAFETLRRSDLPSRSEVRRLALEMSLPTLVVGIIGVFTILRPVTDKLSAFYKLGLRGPHDWLAFWRDFGRLFLGAGRSSRPWIDLAFWVVASVIFVPGLIVLARHRRFDLLALIVAVFLSATSVFVVGGSGFIQPGITRYGLFLVVPATLAAASAVRALLVETVDFRGRLMRHGQHIGLIAMAAVLLWSCDLRRARNQVLDGPPRRDQSIWTLGDDRGDSRRLLLRRAIAKVDGVKASAKAVIVPDFMTRSVLQYLALPRRDLTIIELGALGHDDVPQAVDRYLREGAVLAAPAADRSADAAMRWLISPYPHDSIAIRSGSATPYMLHRVRAAAVAAGEDSALRRR